MTAPDSTPDTTSLRELEPSHAHIAAIVAMIVSATGSAIQAVKLVLAVGVRTLLGNSPDTPAPPGRTAFLLWYAGAALLVFLLAFAVGFLHSRRVPAGLIALASGAGVAYLAFRSPEGAPFSMRWVVLIAGALTAILGMACAILPPRRAR